MNRRESLNCTVTDVAIAGDIGDLVIFCCIGEGRQWRWREGNEVRTIIERIFRAAKPLPDWGDTGRHVIAKRSLFLNATTTPATMSYQTQEQVLHDRINLSKLVKKLDKAIQETDWSEDNSQSLWIQCQSMIQVRVSSSIFARYEHRYCCC